jgi:hypothetical protein
MRQVLALLAFVTVIAACKKNNNDSQMTADLHGRFKGSFYRTGNVDTAQVNIFFQNDNSFTGSSDKTNYPAICGGSFQANGTNLTVDDTCSWTANFDWTLIFDGNYNMSFSDENSVRIWRTNGTVSDEYNLRRITR